MTVGPLETVVECNGLKINTTRWGEPALPTIIIHHGFLEHSRAWDYVAKQLCSRWHLIIPDARGHGDSDWLPAGGTYYFPDYVLDLRALHLSLGEKPVAMIGHSMGGSVVSYYAGAYPDAVRGLAIIEGLGPPHIPVADTPHHLRRFVEGTRRWLQRRDPEPMESVAVAAERLRRSDSKLSEHLSLEVAKHATRPLNGGGVAWKFDPLHRAPMGIPFSLDRARQLWRASTAPVLHIRGGDSGFVVTDHEARKNEFQDLREVVIDGGGHNMHVHAADRLASEIASFLEQLDE